MSANITSNVISKNADFAKILMDKIIGYVKKVHKKPLSMDSLRDIQAYMAKIRITPNTSIELAVKYHLSYVLAIISDNSEVDMHEYLNSAIGIEEDDQSVDKKYKNTVDQVSDADIKAIEISTLFLLKAADAYNLSKELAPSSKLKYNYLMLDSNNAYETNSDRTEFKWLINQKGANKYLPGYINLPSIIRNIKMARLGRTTFAYMPTNTVDLIRTRARIGFSFKEFASQALIMPSGTKFNFLQFMPESDTNYGCSFTLTSFFHNRGYFRFRERYKNLDSLTMSIWDLFTPAKIPLPDVFVSLTATQNDIFTDSFISTTNINSALIINNTYFPAITNGLTDRLYTNEIVNISGFTTLDPVGEAAIITAYNGPHSLVHWGQSFYYAPSPVGTTAFGSVVVTITFRFKPRFTGVIELISEDDEDEGV